MQGVLSKIGRGGIVLLALVTVLPGIVRLVSVSTATPVIAEPADQRYYEHPVMTWLHILPGGIFMLVGPFQFSRSIRSRWIRLHRALGKIFIISGIGAAVVSFGMVFRFPVLGGAVTGLATFTFGLLMIFALLKAYTHIRRREIASHREWMIRAFAIGLGVSTIRLVIGIGLVAGYRILDVFGISFWIGFGINVLAAELLIQRTRVIKARA